MDRLTARPASRTPTTSRPNLMNQSNQAPSGLASLLPYTIDLPHHSNDCKYKQGVNFWMQHPYCREHACPVEGYVGGRRIFCGRQFKHEGDHRDGRREPTLWYTLYLPSPTDLRHRCSLFQTARNVPKVLRRRKIEALCTLQATKFFHQARTR